MFTNSSRASRTRARILDAAASVIRQHGLAAATTREIARAAALTEAALYKYFPSKDDLFLAVLLERLPGLPDTVKDLRNHVGRSDPAVVLTNLALSALTGMTPLEGYLATTPGGVYAVLATAISSGVDLTFVVAVQVLRVIVMLLLAPALARLIGRGNEDRPLDP